METSDLIKWVAEELLGWDVAFEGAEWVRIAPHPLGVYDSLKRSLESWHGIGLVIAEMEKRSERAKEIFDDMLTGERWDEHWWWSPIPWDKVFTAARRAVEGVTSDGGSNDGS
jgi:hypothetical protein